MTGSESDEMEAPQRKGRPKFVRQKRTWRAKFHDSWRGFRQSIREQSSYQVHFFFAAASLGLGLFFHFDLIRWFILIFAIVLVISAEMLNTSIEMLAREVTDEKSVYVEQALNIASGAVLLVASGASLIGILLFGEALLRYLGVLP